MKTVAGILLIIFPLLAFSQNSDNAITSYLNEGFKAPNTHHIGDAWLNFLLEAEADFNYNITQATFSPNSTLDWQNMQRLKSLQLLTVKVIIKKGVKSLLSLKKVM